MNDDTSESYNMYDVLINRWSHLKKIPEFRKTIDILKLDLISELL